MSKKIVEEIINECIEADAPFTEYDIIPEARARGCKLDKKRIQNIIKNIRYPVYYKRNILSVNDVLTDIYHPAFVDPDDYDTSDIGIDISKRKKFKKIKKDLEKKKYEKVHLLNKDNTYVVPRYKAAKAGIKPGDTVYIKCHQNKYIEVKTRLVSNIKNTDTVLKSDCYNNIRIYKTWFLKTFSKIPNTVNIIVRQGNIKIYLDS